MSAVVTESRSSPTVVSHIAASLARLILSGEHGFQPGSRLRISMLSEMFDASPTPIKEALRDLHGQGLVVINPRRGTSVATLSARDFEEITVLRVELELLAVRLAAQLGFEGWILPELRRAVVEQGAAVAGGNVTDYFSLDLQFHGLIARSSSNRLLASVYGDLTRRAAIRAAYLNETGDAMAASLLEHSAILDSLERGDLNGADRLLTEHTAHARTRSQFHDLTADRRDDA